MRLNRNPHFLYFDHCVYRKKATLMWNCNSLCIPWNQVAFSTLSGKLHVFVHYGTCTISLPKVSSPKDLTHLKPYAKKTLGDCIVAAELFTNSKAEVAPVVSPEILHWWLPFCLFRPRWLGRKASHNLEIQKITSVICLPFQLLPNLLGTGDDLPSQMHWCAWDNIPLSASFCLLPQLFYLGGTTYSWDDFFQKPIMSAAPYSVQSVLNTGVLWRCVLVETIPGRQRSATVPLTYHHNPAI